MLILINRQKAWRLKLTHHTYTYRRFIVSLRWSEKTMKPNLIICMLQFLSHIRTLIALKVWLTRRAAWICTCIYLFPHSHQGYRSPCLYNILNMSRYLLSSPGSVHCPYPPCFSCQKFADIATKKTVIYIDMCGRVCYKCKYGYRDLRDSKRKILRGGTFVLTIFTTLCPTRKFV